MMMFREFLRQRRRTASKGAEDSGHGSLGPDLIRIDDRQVRLRWRRRVRVRVVHVLEAK